MEQQRKDAEMAEENDTGTGDENDEVDDDDVDDPSKPPKEETPEEENARLRAALKKANGEAKKYRLAAKGKPATPAAKPTSDGTPSAEELEARIAAAREEERELSDTAWGQRLIKTEARGALALAGAINPQRAVGLLDLDGLDLDDEGEVLGLREAIKDLKKEMPSLFKAGTTRSTDHKSGGEGPGSKEKELTATQRQALKLQGKPQP